MHCITKEIGAADPILIRHQALENTTDTVNPYTITAYIRHRSGIQDAYVYWTTDTAAGYQSLLMTAGTGNLFTVSIPPQPAGTIIYYYVSATSLSGKSQVRPMPAPFAYWHFNVTGITGIASVDHFDEIKEVYPNPSHGITCIHINLATSGMTEAYLMDASGRQILEVHQGLRPSGDQNLFMDTASLSAGIYHLIVKTPSGIFNKPVAVQ